jgi:Cu(I)/Ag(I) efflux system membrane fusion protein
MSEQEKFDSQIDEMNDPSEAVAQAEQLRTDSVRKADRRDARRWWLKLVVQPLLLVVFVACLIAGVGIAQKYGYISAGGASQQTASADKSVRYICPMMCTPPQSEPGRCPTCAMELVPATSGGGGGENFIEIASSARRIANIQTVSVESMPMTRTIKTIGEISYDEGTLKTLSAYVDGRLDRLFADYTGVVVEKGDHLALVYSPRLYSSQVELLLARKGRENSRSATIQRVIKSNDEMYESSKQRLIELGMTQAQIDELEKTGEASRRLHLCAPISGTVIEKLAVEGQYVKEGQAIYKLADLSTVWLMLELFPEDASAIRYGQRVDSEVQSLPGRKFAGRVAFIDKHVNPKTRTVGVRVVIENPDGQLRTGDYAKAKIDIPIVGRLASNDVYDVYDAELANKWISPRHPHVVRESAGLCPVCGVDLVPASQFGFLSEPTSSGESLVIPRDAVLMAGNNSVVYVETEPGRFEIRRVTLGPNCGEQIVVLSGVSAGEHVATRGNFLIDSQMQLAGNPSLIDPTKIDPTKIRLLPSEAFTPEMLAALDGLKPTDRELAMSQRVCPVTDMLLGSMGQPPKIQLGDRTVFVCCQGCQGRLVEDPDKFLAKLNGKSVVDEKEEQTVRLALADLTPEDRRVAESQRICPVADMRLGTMGVPHKVDVNGVPVFICCAGCRESLLEEPEKYLAKLASSRSGDSDDGDSSSGLPPIGEPQPLEPHGGLPPIGIPQLELDSSEDNIAQSNKSAEETKGTEERSGAEFSSVPRISDVPMELIR